MSIYDKDGALKIKRFTFCLDDIKDMKLSLNTYINIISNTNASNLHRRHYNPTLYNVYYQIVTESSKEDPDGLLLNRLSDELEKEKLPKYTNIVTTNKKDTIHFYIDGFVFGGSLLRGVFFEYTFKVLNPKTKASEAVLEFIEVSIPSEESVKYLLEDKQNNNIAGWLETAAEQVLKFDSSYDLNIWLKTLLKTEFKNAYLSEDYMNKYFNENEIEVKVLTEEEHQELLQKDPMQKLADELYDGRIDVAIRMSKLKNKPQTEEQSLFTRKRSAGFKKPV